MFKNALKTCCEVILAAVIFLAIAEGICFAFGIAPGMEDFVQATLMRHHLSTRKPAQEIRIFTYGESTMHGASYAPQSSPAQWLEVYLRDFLPGRTVRVINFARMGKGIDYTSRVFFETLPYKPDIAVFYSGHNDFLPQNRIDDLQKSHSMRRQWIGAISQSRFISLLYRQLIRFRMRRNAAKQDRMGHAVIETPLNDRTGTYPTLRNDPVYQKTVRFFSQTVESILTAGQKRGVHILFLTPVSNLKDFPPMKSEHMKDLSAEQSALWQESFTRGVQLQAEGDPEGALQNFEQAYELDRSYADLPYRIGQILLAKGEFDPAKRFLEEARDHDVKIVRATKEIDDALWTLAKSKGLQLVDIEKDLSAEVPGGVLGFPIIEDNVHFSVKGQSLVGRRLALAIAERDWILPRAEWRPDRERSYEAIASELGIDTALLVSAFIKEADYFGGYFKERLYFASKAADLAPNDPSALRALAWSYWLSGNKAEAAKIYARLKQVDGKTYREVRERVPDLKMVMPA